MDKIGHDPKEEQISFSVKLVALYLLIVGSYGLLAIASQVSAKSGLHVSDHIPQIIFSTLYLICAVSIFMRKSWCITSSIIALVVTVPASARDFAWGFASDQTGGAPSQSLLITSIALISAWHLFLIYFLYVNRSTSRASQSNGA